MLAMVVMMVVHYKEQLTPKPFENFRPYVNINLLKLLKHPASLGLIMLKLAVASISLQVNTPIREFIIYILNAQQYSSTALSFLLNSCLNAF